MREYVLTNNILSRLKNAGLDAICDRCREPLKAGEVVMRAKGKRKGRWGFKQMRHKKCMEEMYYSPTPTG